MGQILGCLEFGLWHVVTTYLYESINTNIYMKIPKWFKLPETTNPKPRNMYSIKLQRSLYGLKQSGRMWYNRLSEYLLKEWYVNNLIFSCVFIKKSETRLTIIAVYVGDLNLYEGLLKSSQRSKENKILSQLVDRALFKWLISPSINIYRESIITILYGFMEQVTWAYIIQKNQNHNWLGI